MEYYIKITKENISQWEYFISLQQEKYLYFENFNLEANGDSYFDFIIPLSDTYNILINSPSGDFEAKLYLNKREDESHKMFYDISLSGKLKKTIGLLAGAYRLRINGVEGQKIQVIIWKSNVKKEIEPNNTFTTATRYSDNIQGLLEKDGQDIYEIKTEGPFNFVINSFDFTDNDTVEIEILNENGLMLTKFIKKAKNKKISIPLNIGKGLRFIKIINKIEKEIEYTLSGAIPPEMVETSREVVYKANYKNYLLGLPTNLVYKEEEQEKGDAGNLIILTGVGDKSDTLYKASNSLAKNYYKIFNYRGLSDDDIYYFSFENKIDVDEDGIDDNVVDDSTPSAEEFYKAITNWAVETGKKGPLYIYMVDHGGTGTFKVKNGDIVIGSELREKIDEFYNKTGRQVILIIEACKSGSFLKYMLDSDYITVVTSSKSNELSFIDSKGKMSFSLLFARKLFAGMNLHEAFDNALSQLPNHGRMYAKQHPQIHLANEGIEDIYVGENFVTAGMEFVNISETGEDKDVSDGNIWLWLKLKANKGIKRVWAVVIPPYFKLPPEVKDYETIDLTPFTVELKYDKEANKYKGEFDNASVNGKYEIVYYVEDTDGNIVTKKVDIYGTGADTTLKCNKEYLYLCETKDKCISLGGYWYNDYCYSTPEKNAQEKIEIQLGWNLKALPVMIEQGIDIKLFDKYGINTIWRWSGNSWMVYSPLENIMELLKKYNITIISKLNSGEGFWINAGKNMSVNVNDGKEYGMEALKINKGWNLVGIGKELISDEFDNFGDIKTIWKWTGSKWKVWSPIKNIMRILNDYGISPIEKIEKGEGFWINR